MRLLEEDHAGAIEQHGDGDDDDGGRSYDCDQIQLLMMVLEKIVFIVKV